MDRFADREQRLTPIQVTPPTPTWKDGLEKAAKAEGLKPNQWVLQTLTRAMREGGHLPTAADTI